MIRLLMLCAVLCEALFLTVAARAEPPARLYYDRSALAPSGEGAELRLVLSQGVPFRVFTMDDPPRLVIDLRGLETQDAPPDVLDPGVAEVSDVRIGTFQPGWLRLVADLRGPMLPRDVEMAIDATTDEALLKLFLRPADPVAFANASGVPPASGWPTAAAIPRRVSKAPFVVVLDPGHGGIDPGAERDGLSEKVLALDVARQVQAKLEAEPDIEVVLTREKDVFVALQTRVGIAHQVQADLFVSIHADALSEGGAHGATVYTLSEKASDTASAHLATRHNRADIIAGLDLTGSDDEVTRVLLDLARQETEPRTMALARLLADHMAKAGGPMNRRPMREAGFSVLKSADIPSVLVEVGFLSSQRDLENLRDPRWLTRMSHAMADAILAWRQIDKEHRALVRR